MALEAGQNSDSYLRGAGWSSPHIPFRLDFSGKAFKRSCVSGRSGSCEFTPLLPVAGLRFQTSAGSSPGKRTRQLPGAGMGGGDRTQRQKPASPKLRKRPCLWGEAGRGLEVHLPCCCRREAWRRGLRAGFPPGGSPLSAAQPRAGSPPRSATAGTPPSGHGRPKPAKRAAASPEASNELHLPLTRSAARHFQTAEIQGPQPLPGPPPEQGHEAGGGRALPLGWSPPASPLPPSAKPLH